MAKIKLETSAVNVGHLFYNYVLVSCAYNGCRAKEFGFGFFNTKEKALFEMLDWEYGRGIPCWVMEAR